MAQLIKRNIRLQIISAGARFLALLVVAAAWLLCVVAHAQAQSENAAMERRLKAAFTYKFAAYVTWPANAFTSASAPLVFGVAGADDIARELQAATDGHAASGRPFVIRAVKPGRSLDGLHVLFVGESEAARLTQWVQALNGRPVLVVTDHPGALEQGSVINFITDERRVRFDISLVFADRYRLRIDSRLLDVAQDVQRER